MLLSGSRADGPACLSSYSAISDELCHLKNIRVIDCLRAFGKWESGAPLVFSLALSAILSLSFPLSLPLFLSLSVSLALPPSLSFFRPLLRSLILFSSVPHPPTPAGRCGPFNSAERLSRLLRSNLFCSPGFIDITQKPGLVHLFYEESGTEDSHRCFDCSCFVPCQGALGYG